MKKSMTILIAALIASPALASNWVRFGTGGDGTIQYIDADSMKLVSKGVWKVWTKNEAGTSAKYKAIKVSHIVRQLTLNCNDETITLGSGALYSTDGSNTSLSPKYVPEAAMPDSVGGNIIDLICKELPASIEKDQQQ